MIERRHMHFSQRFRRRIATGLMILFLALALVPIYQILAKFAPGGRFVQLCSAMGVQTVWVADEGSTIELPALISSDQQASSISDGLNSPNSLLNVHSANPFGSCEFCWVSVLATVLPLALVLFFAIPKRQFNLPVVRKQVFRFFLGYWHLPSRAPPFSFSI